MDSYQFKVGPDTTKLLGNMQENIYVMRIDFQEKLSRMQVRMEKIDTFDIGVRTMQDKIDTQDTGIRTELVSVN